MNVTERFRALFGKNNYYITFSPEQTPIVDGMSARTLYATQANLHAVVSFLSDSIAQLPLKVYKRSGETDRERDRVSPAAQLLWRPNSDQTAYELVNGLATELFLMGVGVLWLLPDADSPSGYQLRIIPREWIADMDGATNYAPDKLKVRATGNGQYIEIPKDQKYVFDKIYDYCEREGIKLVLYAVPSPHCYNMEMHNGYAKLAQEYGLDFLDGNVEPEKIGIDFEKDYFDNDADHLNLFGTRKMTAYIADYLVRECGLEDHRGDAAYQSWTDILADYEQEVKDMEGTCYPDLENEIKEQKRPHDYDRKKYGPKG